jgi:DNA-binding winged helix-turn-helix (wHTH) protein
MTRSSTDHRRRRRRWRFANAVFDEANWTLQVDGQITELESKPLQVLHELLLNAGEAVTKGELMDAVWPGVHVVEASLTTAVSKLRGALHDRDAVVIQTLPRIGYRLTAPVEVEQLSTPLAPRFAFQPDEHVPGRPQWILQTPLGDTGAGDVWRARHEKSDATRIFKFADAPDRLRALRREVALYRLMAAVLGERRPCPDVLEWNFETSPYFIESQDAGRDLKLWAAEAGGLSAMPLERRLDIMIALARAVAAAHEAGVLHKDLKPANILIADTDDASDDHGGFHLRLADFGSGWLVDQEALSLHGISGDIVIEDDGSSRSDTPAYRAPEVVAGAAPGAASDIYALGLILYQMVVGDLDKPLAAGWEADVADPLLRQDIASAAAGDVAARMASAAVLAERLETLPRRRADHVAALIENQRRQTEALREERRSARRPWVRTAVAVGVIGLLATSFTTVMALGQRNEARARTEAAEASYAFLTDDLLGQTSPSSGSPAQETLAAAALRAQSVIDARFQRQPAIAADLHLSLANAFAQRTEFDAARRGFELADAAFKRAGLEDSPAAARGRLLHARTEAMSAQPGGLDRAKALLAAERARLGGDAGRGMAGFHVAQVEGVVGFFSDLEASAAAFARAQAIAETRPEGLAPRDILLARQQQAVVLMRLGRPAEALPLLQASVREWTDLLGADHANTLIARQNLIQARLMLGEVRPALSEADALLPLLSERFGSTSRYALSLQSTRYEALMSLGDHAAAAVAAEAVWRGAEASQGPASHQALGGRNDLGLTLCRTADRRAGLEHLGEAYRGVRAAFGDDYDLTHVIRFYLGECLVLDGRPAQAKVLLDQVDRARVGALVGDAEWGVLLDLAQAEIALAQGDKDRARTLAAGLSVLGTDASPPHERARYAALTRALARPPG